MSTLSDLSKRVSTSASRVTLCRTIPALQDTVLQLSVQCEPVILSEPGSAPAVPVAAAGRGRKCFFNRSKLEEKTERRELAIIIIMAGKKKRRQITRRPYYH